MRPPLLATALLAAVLAGCAGITGDAPCGGADYGVGNRESAGTYAGTYKNFQPFGDSMALDLKLDLVIADDSHITGTVKDAENRTASVTGHLADWFYPCKDDTTTLEIEFAFDGEPTRSLMATRKRRAFTTFTAKATYRQNVGQNPQLGEGTLAITRQ